VGVIGARRTVIPGLRCRVQTGTERRGGKSPEPQSPRTQPATSTRSRTVAARPLPIGPPSATHCFARIVPAAVERLGLSCSPGCCSGIPRCWEHPSPPRPRRDAGRRRGTKAQPSRCGSLRPPRAGPGPVAAHGESCVFQPPARLATSLRPELVPPFAATLDRRGLACRSRARRAHPRSWRSNARFWGSSSSNGERLRRTAARWWGLAACAALLAIAAPRSPECPRRAAYSARALTPRRACSADPCSVLRARWEPTMTASRTRDRRRLRRRRFRCRARPIKQLPARAPDGGPL